MTAEEHAKRRREAVERAARKHLGQIRFARNNRPGTLASGQGNRKRGGLR